MFEKSTQKLQTMMALAELRKNLEKLGPMPTGTDAYDYAVKFFNLVAAFNDKYSITEDMFKGSKKSAEILRKHLKNCGRDKYGMVRAPKGEIVTLDNLYLGNVDGLNTLPAYKFKDSKDKEVQEIIQNQLHLFINSHRVPMIDLINSVLDGNKKPNTMLLKLFGKTQVAGR